MSTVRSRYCLSLNSHYSTCVQHVLIMSIAINGMIAAAQATVLGMHFNDALTELMFTQELRDRLFGYYTTENVLIYYDQSSYVKL